MDARDALLAIRDVRGWGRSSRLAGLGRVFPSTFGERLMPQMCISKPGRDLTVDIFPGDPSSGGG